MQVMVCQDAGLLFHSIVPGCAVPPRRKGIHKMAKEIEPSRHLEDFLNFLDQCAREYRYASDNMATEDKRLQDLLHELEFAADKAERNRVATSLQRSRRERRRSKDKVKLYERIVKFSEDQNNRRTINLLRQLLGQQRKEEEYLRSNRTYKKRVDG